VSGYLTPFLESLVPEVLSPNTGRLLVGSGKLIDPVQLERVFVSPRKRARKTFELLFGTNSELAALDKVEFTKDIAEWGYGAYEGLFGEEIVARRKE